MGLQSAFKREMLTEGLLKHLFHTKMHFRRIVRVPPTIQKEARLQGCLHGRFRPIPDLYLRDPQKGSPFDVIIKIECPSIVIAPTPESGAPKQQRARSGGRRPPHPKDSRAPLHIRAGIRTDYVVVSPHYLRGPSGPA